MPSRLTNPLEGHHLPLQYFSPTQALFLQPPLAATAAFTLVNGTAYFTWMPLSDQYHVIGLGVSLAVVAGDNTSQVRFGIYNNAANGWPSSLIVDAGLTNCGGQAGVSTGALLSPPFDITLNPGGYWGCVVVQNYTTGAAQLQRVANSAIPHVGTPSPDVNLYIGYTTPNITGPLPPMLGVAPFFFSRSTVMIALAPQVYPVNN